MANSLIVVEGKTRRKGVSLSCQQCLNIFVRRKWGNGTAPKFCSRKCFSDSRPSVDVECFCCKNVFKRSASKIKNSKSGLQFCSRSCKEKTQRIESGVKEIQPDHYGEVCENYKEVAKRHHGEFCKDCGIAVPFLLFVHHVDGDRRNNHPENLEVLCFNHHIIRHLRKTSDGQWKLSYRSLTPRDEIKNLISLVVDSSCGFGDKS